MKLKMSIKSICKNRVFIFLLFCFSIICVFAKVLPEKHKTFTTEKYAKVDDSLYKSQNVRIVFYNTENLYDPYDDTTKLDDEFTVKGKKRWTYGKFSIKLTHFAKTMMAIGGNDLPALIGLSEIENRYVMNKIIYETPLKKFHYRFVHHESPDARGIDVALLYRPEKFQVISSRAIRILFPFDTSIRTREILYVRGILFHEDTLHVFVNHWPSKLGGVIVSETRRKFVASVLRKCVDSIFQKHPKANILIMGDFNDEPDQPSIKDVLRAGPINSDTRPDELVNLMCEKQKDWNHGTIKFQGKWTIIDQFIVSSSLIGNDMGLHTSEQDARIFQGDFLMEKETTFLGSKPLRTYAGPRYIGGFSDHLPIYLDIRKR
jgi:endonuclease/exonuclease/phosphatase family metal-dependent hydrolase